LKEKLKGILENKKELIKIKIFFNYYKKFINVTLKFSDVIFKWKIYIIIIILLNYINLKSIKIIYFKLKTILLIKKLYLQVVYIINNKLKYILKNI